MHLASDSVQCNFSFTTWMNAAFHSNDRGSVTIGAHVQYVLIWSKILSFLPTCARYCVFLCGLINKGVTFVYAFCAAQYAWISWLWTYVGEKYVNLADSFVLGKEYLADTFALQQSGPVIHVAMFKELIILWIVASVVLPHALVFWLRMHEWLMNTTLCRALHAWRKKNSNSCGWQPPFTNIWLVLWCTPDLEEVTWGFLCEIGVIAVPGRCCRIFFIFLFFGVYSREWCACRLGRKHHDSRRSWCGQGSSPL